MRAQNNPHVPPRTIFAESLVNLVGSSIDFYCKNGGTLYPKKRYGLSDFTDKKMPNFISNPGCFLTTGISILIRNSNSDLIKINFFSLHGHAIASDSSFIGQGRVYIQDFVRK